MFRDKSVTEQGLFFWNFLVEEKEREIEREPSENRMFDFLTPLTLFAPHSHRYGQNTQIVSKLSPKRDWGPKRG